MKRSIIIASAILLVLSLAACDASQNHPAFEPEVNSNDYYTQTNMSELEYKMYLADKISTATGQINTHMSKIKNVADGSCTPADEKEALEASIEILKEDKKDLNYVYPPDSYSSIRTRALDYWQDAIDKMQEICDELDNGTISESTAMDHSSELKDIFTSIQSLNI